MKKENKVLDLNKLSFEELQNQVKKLEQQKSKTQKSIISFRVVTYEL